MTNQFTKQNKSKLYLIYLIILPILIVFANLSSTAQSKPDKPARIYETWEIAFGHSFGRYHENFELFTINDKGEATFRENKDAPITEKLPYDILSELNGLVEKLDLSKVKNIPDGKYNSCIASLHLPETYFKLEIGGRSYKLRHCNNTKDYAYTLILSREQKEIYRQLREKALKESEILQNNQMRLQSAISTDADGRIDSTETKMIFRLEYENYAWGYVGGGWLIDLNGNVYHYEYKLGKYEQGRQKFEFKTTPTLISRVAPELLTEKLLWSRKAAQGKFNRKNAANDAGSRVYSAFLANPLTNKFVEIKLKESGDWEEINSAPEAAALVKWLDTVFPNSDG